MALVIVHPDYITVGSKQKSVRNKSKYPIEMYEDLLKYVKGKKNYWHALPGEVADWRRARSNRKLVVQNGSLRIVPELEGGKISTIKKEKLKADCGKDI